MCSAVPVSARVAGHGAAGLNITTSTSNGASVSSSPLTKDSIAGEGMVQAGVCATRTGGSGRKEVGGGMAAAVVDPSTEVEGLEGCTMVTLFREGGEGGGW